MHVVVLPVMKKLLLVTYYFCLLLLFFTFAPSALAATEGDFGAYPTNYDPENPRTKSWFIYELKPGQTKEDSITVVNNSEEEITLKIYPVDATTTGDGAFALLNEDERQMGIGTWVTIAKDTITIGPKDRVDVPFTIAIPKYATVGDHPGGIIIQPAEAPTAKAKGMGVNIVSRVGTRIYQTVPGAKVLNLEVKDLAYKIEDEHLVFTYTLVNKGNVILTPTGTFDITDASGKKVDTIPLASLGSVFPGKPTQITTKSTITAPWFGQYKGTVTLTYSPLKQIQKSIEFFIYIRDWRVAMPVVGLLLLILLFNLRKMFRHGKRIKTAKARVEQAEPTSLPIPRPALAPALATAPAVDVDQAFIGKHIRLLVGFACISILILSALFAFVLQSYVLGGPNQTKATAAPTQTPVEADPTDIPEKVSAPVEKASIKVAIYNGSGTAGAARAVADELTKEGFTVTKTDNALELLPKTLVQYPVGKGVEAAALGAALPAAYSDYTQEEASNSGVFTITLGQQ